MYVNFGYFRAHMYTCIPRQIDADMARMQAMGANAVTVSVLEQDLFAAVENLRIITHMAREHGLAIHADVARWGGLVSGTPKVPSLWASIRPEFWKRKADGRPVTSFGKLCPVLSIFHPETETFFREQLARMFEVVAFDGIFWNEPKAISSRDYGDAARAWCREHEQDIDDPAVHARAHVDFFGRLNGYARSLMPDLEIGCFLVPGEFSHAQAFAAMEGLDTFGCDGRAWGRDDESAPLSYTGKCLLDLAPPFIDLARQHGRRTFGFIENIGIPDDYLPILDRRLPEVLAMDFDHLMLYYYGRSVESPDQCMEIIARHVRDAVNTKAGG